MSQMDTVGGSKEEIEAVRARWREAATWISKKRKGNAVPTTSEPKAPKRRRVKTFTTAVALDNMI